MARSIFKKLVQGLTRTRESIAATLGGLGRAGKIDEESIETLEAGLLAADLGPELTAEVIGVVRERAAADAGGIVDAVRATLRGALDHDARVERATKPHVIFVVGVNGGGKTTASSRGVDTVLVDTAGRLHTKTHLMAELEKLGRVARREVEGAPHEVLLVVDATTGQNGLVQAEEFTRVTRLTGVVLTKLDGTAKGGVALVIQRKVGVPVRYVGVGEGLDDLLVFDPDAYVDGLLAV